MAVPAMQDLGRKPPRRVQRRRMFLFLMRQFGMSVMLAVFLGCYALSNHSTERVGDNMQIALPLVGLSCALAEGRGLQYFGRFLLMEALLHGSKTALAGAPINRRPNGGGSGFPSGHTTASAFGATALVQGCLATNKGAQAVVVIGAGFVGTSRVEAGAHTIWQVVAGALLGWLVQVAKLWAFDRMVQRAVAACVGVLRRVLRLTRRAWVSRRRRAAGRG